jgi:hypothetical protein
MINLLHALKSHFEPFELGILKQIQRLRDIVIDELEIRILQKVIDVRLRTRNKIIDANNVRLFH